MKGADVFQLARCSGCRQPKGAVPNVHTTLPTESTDKGPLTISCSAWMMRIILNDAASPHSFTHLLLREMTRGQSQWGGGGARARTNHPGAGRDCISACLPARSLSRWSVVCKLRAWGGEWREFRTLSHSITRVGYEDGKDRRQYFPRCLGQVGRLELWYVPFQASAERNEP